MRSKKPILAQTAGLAILTLGLAVANGRAPSAAPRPSSVDGQQQQILDAYARLPVSFVENRGQMDPRVRYYAQGNRFGFYLTSDQVTLAFANDATDEQISLALRFVDRNPRSALVGAGRAPGEVNYFRGADPAAWQTGLPQYRDVVYRELWPGIDLRLHEQAGVLKYEFHVRPGGRPADIRLAYAGASGLSLDDSGGMLIATSAGVLRDAAPFAYQDVGGARVPVTSRYALDTAVGRDRRFGFSIDAYEPDRDLIIDPGIQYTTFLGGGSHEIGAGIAVDATGNAYVVGTTQSPDFPTTAGAFRRTGATSNFADVFVSKLNAAGTALVYSTFIGGSNFDFGRRIAIDASGNAYVTGQTKSSNFPTTGSAFDRSFNIPPNCPRCSTDQYDAFVTKLNAAGSALVYSTFLGGTDIDDARGIAVDAGGAAYVTGETVSADFPTTAGALSRTSRGAYDVFVTKLNAAGSALAYSTYLGGTQVDDGERVAVDASGNAFVVGFTSSIDFPVTAGAFDTTANGAFDVFVAKLNPSGSGLIYSTYLGGNDFDSVGGLAIDDAGNAYVAGGTGSLNFPTTAGAFDTTPDGSDAFLTKVNAAGSALVYSTVLGGTASDGANGVDVDGAGNAWLTGITSSANFPVTAGAADASFNGVADVFIAELNAAGSSLLYSTYLGGAQSDSGNDVAIDSAGDVYVTGHTYSIDFPATTGAFDTIFNGDPSIFWGDAFVTKLATNTGTSTPPPPPATPGTPTLLAPADADTPPQPITFDWSDATSAVSYTIQIDDSSAFSAPLVREQSVTTSIYATSNLATTTHFWRVRGVNSAGTPGAWSVVRSFTPQAAPPPATLSTMSTNPSTVVGGDASSGTVVLSVGAPEGGALVTLSSSNPAVASVPSSATVPANGFTATFPIATSPVSASTTITITAAYNGSTRTATLGVTPQASAPPPAGTATLTVTATGRSGERVTSSPAGISVAVGSSGSASFTTGTAITLTVSNGRDAIWSGACSSGGGKAKSCTFTLNATASVTANVQ
jgi:hypothetical protein